MLWLRCGAWLAPRAWAAPRSTAPPQMVRRTKAVQHPQRAPPTHIFTPKRPLALDV